MTDRDTVALHAETHIIDALQYPNCEDRVRLEEWRAGGLDCVHVTIAYHERLGEAIGNITAWHRLFRRHSDLICHARTAADIRAAKRASKTAVVFGFQNPSPIEDDIGLVQVFHELGVRVMQLTYNNQSLLGCGCYEAEDSGITRMGKRVIAEMNRLGMLIDMSHSAERTTLEAIDLSERPIAITHANPAYWHPALRNKSDHVLEALAGRGGMLGFSLYPLHLKDHGACTLDSFCDMVARTADRMGVDRIGIGSDLCKGWGYEVLEWMRRGRWTFAPDFGEDESATPAWPDPPDWFRSAADMPDLTAALLSRGFAPDDVKGIMGENWLRFWDDAFRPMGDA